MHSAPLLASILNRRIHALEKLDHFATVEDAFKSLPALRSRVSKQQDSIDSWQTIVHENASYLLNKSSDVLLKQELEAIKAKVSLHTQTGGLRFSNTNNTLHNTSTKLDTWFSVNRPSVWLNHETRSHMESDLRRYLFASAFSKAHGYSPKGADDINIDHSYMFLCFPITVISKFAIDQTSLSNANQCRALLNCVYKRTSDNGLC